MPARINRVITKRGDHGETALADGNSYPKTHGKIHFVGELDEANCQLGVLTNSLSRVAPEHVEFVRSIQSRLFDIGAGAATGTASGSFASEVTAVEVQTQRLNEGLEPLREFVLPGGGEPATQAHLARAKVRRAERAFWAVEAQALIEAHMGKYLNRLSDYLFVLARTLSETEVLWEPLNER